MWRVSHGTSKLLSRGSRKWVLGWTRSRIFRKKFSSRSCLMNEKWNASAWKCSEFFNSTGQRSWSSASFVTQKDKTKKKQFFYFYDKNMIFNFTSDANVYREMRGWRKKKQNFSARIWSSATFGKLLWIIKTKVSRACHSAFAILFFLYFHARASSKKYKKAESW